MVAGSSKLVIAAPMMLVFGVIGVGTTDAQVTTDGRAGPRLQLHGPEFAIGADLGTQASRNLFHSFDKFSLATGERATFSGPDEIRNIISRVTGGERSDIDGTIRSIIPGADFYFINPAGVMFGPNARLDVQGSFRVSTAEELRFADGATFSATNPTASTFTVAAPEAFGFLGAREPAPILVDRSTLEVPAGKTFSLVGGDISVRGDPDAEQSGGPGTVRAESGLITLAGVGGAGALLIESGAVNAVRRADISLVDQAALQTSGNGGGGTIRIRGSRLVMEDNSFLSASNGGATGAVGEISVDADRVRVRRSGLATDVDLVDGGIASDAGPVKVSTGDFMVTDLSSISGQDITITARNDMIVSDGSEISANDTGGRVTITAQNLIIEKQSSISSDANFESDSGDVMITADDLILRDSRISSGTFTDGRGGSVTVRVGNLTVGNLGLISTDTFSEGAAGEGAAGDLIVTANRLILRGEISNRSLGTGDAGRVTVTANNIFLEVGFIDSLVSGFESFGNGGDVIVRADSHLSLRDGSFISADNYYNGNAGSIEVEAVTIDLQDSAISSSSDGSGAAGTIRIEGATRIELEGARISTTSGASGGGDIEIEANDLVLLRAGSRIGADVFFGGARAGNITIDPTFLVLDKSVIGATADAGSGGRIDIRADQLILSPDSEITARAGPAGIAGTVVVSAPEVDLSGGLVVVEGTFLDTAPLRVRCGARRDIGASSFTGVGRGGLPASPDAPLSSAYLGDLATSGDPGFDDAARLPAGFERAVVAARPCLGEP